MLSVASASLVVVALVFVALGLSGVPLPGVLLDAWFLAVGVVACLSFVDRPDWRTASLIAVGAIAVRLVLGAVLLSVFRNDVFRVFDDVTRYLDIGAQISEGWRGGPQVDLYATYGLSVAGYYYIVAAIHYLVGPDLLAVISFNAGVAAITGGAIYRLARQLGAGSREGLVAMAIASFVPSVVFWSAIPLKDTPTTLLLVVGLIAALRLLGPGRTVALASVVACILLMEWFRIYATLFITLAALSVLVFQRSFKRAPVWSVTATVIILVVQAWTLQTPVGQQVTQAATDLNELERQRDIFDRGASSESGREPTSGWVIGASSQPSGAPTAAPTTAAPTPTAAPTTAAPTPTAAPTTAAPTPTAAPTTAAPTPTAAPTTAAPTPTPRPTLPPPRDTADRVSRYIALVLQEPVLMFQYLALPIPFVTHGTLVGLALPEMVVWYAAIPVVIAGLVLLYRRQRATAVMLVLVNLAMAAVYGTLVSNAGSLLRYRSQALVLLAIPLAVGLFALWRRIRWSRSG